MSKSIALLLALIFLMASCIIVIKPALSSADVVENSWVSKAPMQVARSSLGVAAVNGKIYAVGGSTQSGMGSSKSGGIVGTTEEYDPVTDAWTFKASMPTPRMDFAIAVYGNKIYCIGGVSNDGYTGVNEVYDPATDTWETKASMPTAKVADANVVQDRIYVIGGAPSNALNQVYEPETDSWTTRAPMPTEAYGASAAAGNKIYVIAGMLNQVYDAETDTWSLGAPPPSSIYPHSRAVVTLGVWAPKRIYVVGPANYIYDPAAANYVYNPATDRWTRGADLPTDREGFDVVVWNDMLYVIGGYTLTYPDVTSIPTGGNLLKYATNEQYTPFGYGTVQPQISVVSPENKNYTSSNVSLTFTLNKPVVWMSYSFDGKENTTVTGNTTLTGLSSGLHNITVYANDTFGNIGSSETITFTISSAPFPTTLVATASAASLTIIGVILLIYFRKRK